MVLQNFNNMIYSHEYAKKEEFQGEIFNKPSETVPDQALTIKEAVHKMRMGTPIPASDLYHYDEEFGEELNPLRSYDLDLTDVQELKEQLKEHLKVIKKSQEETLKKQNEANAKFKEELEEFKRFKELEKDEKLKEKYMQPRSVREVLND